MKRRLADVLVSVALRLYPDARMYPDLDAAMTPDDWAGLLILHAEAVHGCDHTDQARRELGLAGPRAEDAA